MKHLVFTSAMIFAFFIGFSKTKSIRQELNYVVTDRGIMLPEDAINAFRGNFFLNSDKLENYKLNLSNIISVHFNKKEYRTKYVLQQGSKKGKYELLEKIGSNGEYTIYKRIFRSPGNKNDFLLFRSEMQEYRINPNNYQILISIVFPKLNSMIA
jgi:hypothetical protein